MKQRNSDGKKKTGKLLLEIVILFLILALLCTAGIWQAVSCDWEIALGGSLFPQAFIKSVGNYKIAYLNQESLYISFLSVLFSFLGNREDVVSVINLILQLAGVFFFYLGAKRLFHFVFPLAITVISGLLGICFYPVVGDTSMHMIWFLTGFIFWLGSTTYGDRPRDYIKRIFLGVLIGIFCYIDLAGFFLLAAFVLFTLLKKEVCMKGKKITLIYFLYFWLGIINGFFIMFYLWNNFLLDKNVLQYWLNDKLQYFTQDMGMNQYISLGILMGIIAVFYAVKCFTKPAVEPVMEDTVVETVVEPILVEEKISELSLEKDVSKEVTETVSEEINEPEIQDIKVKKPEPEIKKPIKFIENPLPLPKKHVKKEMNYAFEPTSDQMHYDLNNYRLDDDYDLKDI